MKTSTGLWFAAFLIIAAGCAQNSSGHSDGDGHDHAEEGGHDEHGHEGEEHSDEVELTEEAIRIAGIETQPVRSLALQSELSVPGTVSTVPAGRALVTAPVAGRIIKLFVAPGQSIKAGQPIAQIQSADLAEASVRIMEAQRSVSAADAEVKTAASEAVLAKNQVKTAESVLARQKELVRTGAFSQPSLVAAEKYLNDAKAELETAEQEEVVHLAQVERAERLYKMELISRTELEEARLELQRDRTRQETARRQIALAQSTYDRERQIAERGLLNAREIQAAEAELRTARLAQDKAQIQLQSAKVAASTARKAVTAAQQSYRAQAGGQPSAGGLVTVTAPIGGEIVDRHISIGQAVDRTSEIGEIANLNTVWVTARVPEKQIAQARPGAPASVTLTALEGRVFRGTIQSVATQLDAKTRTLAVHVLVENASGVLKPEMFATVRLGVGRESSALTVPKSALVVDGDKKTVFVAVPGEAGHFASREVAVGRTQGEIVEILDGLEEGQAVVVKGAFVLKSELVKGELKGHEH